MHDPRTVLADVARAFRIALRRLYRTWNIILHGGATQGVALGGSLRTAGPLVGAELDRIVHAFYAECLDPLDLAARAEVALSIVDGESALSVVDLLERASPALSAGLHRGGRPVLRTRENGSALLRGRRDWLAGRGRLGGSRPGDLDQCGSGV
ncbi:hypothetical protein ACWGQ5_07690 [Streptomyces sp. NPDC055722]